MKQLLMIAACMLMAFFPGACSWGIVASEQDGDVTQDPDMTGDGEIDASAEIDLRPDTDAPRPDIGDPDIGEPDAGEPDTGEPDTGEPDESEPDTIEPDQPDVVEDDGTGPECGNGIIETGEDCDDGNTDETDDCLNDCSDASCGDGHVHTGVEECDDASPFCLDCALTAPSGWIECTDSSGNTVFLLLVDLPGNNDYQAYRDYCQSTIEAMSPQDYEFYGLAVFSDQDVWDCIRPSLDPMASYYIGIEQDSSAPDFAEPAGGWYWVGYDGTSWNDLSSYSGTTPYLPGSFDDGGGTTGDAECGRLTRTGGTWQFSDYGCTTMTTWNGICMIQF